MPKIPPSKDQSQQLAAFISTTLRNEGVFVNADPTAFTIRLPKPGTLCKITGLSRSAMNALILGSNPPVRSVSVKKKYAVRGIRLVFLHSLISYLLSLAAEQCGGEANQDNGGKA